LIGDIAVFSGSEAMGHYPLVRVNFEPSSNTSMSRKNIIEPGPFKKNIVRCYENTALSSTNNMFGTSSQRAMRRAFSANDLF
jgi:hypothetical protein